MPSPRVRRTPPPEPGAAPGHAAAQAPAGQAPVAQSIARETDAPLSAPLSDSELFLNREIAQLEFNLRVLAQAADARTPLLERLRYLCIACTNLDEFFEVRVATVLTALEFGAPLLPDRTDPRVVLERVHALAGTMVAEQYRLWNEDLRPALMDAGIRVLPRDGWTAAQRDWVLRYFRDEVMPVLSPIGLDPAHPFPRILNKSLNVVVVLDGRDAFGRKGGMAIVRAPRSLPRIIQLPESVSGGRNDFVFLSALLTEFIDELFPGLKVKGAYQFRVTRNSELFVDEEEVENLASALKGELLSRGFRPAVRLEIAEHCPRPIINTLLQHFDLEPQAVYRINGPVNLNRVIQVYDLADRPDLKFPAFVPRDTALGEEDDPFATLRERDVLLHHPFDSFGAVLDLLAAAATDPQVLAIKQTLYRTGKDARIIELLIQAARNGKDVTVVVELRARFDEEANLNLADRLQEAGVQVMYGVVGHKTHAKMILIVRREGHALRRYVHLGTGNYHAGTARAYTDIGLMTADPDIGADVHGLFQQLSGLAPKVELRRLMASPFTLHSGLLSRIEREARHARAGRPGRIIARMNAINESGVIGALYAASQAGVQVDLLVRGACCLRPGVPGLSENIRVRSVVGRFLEHSRVYWFGNDGNPEIFCSSADWMERNLLRRVETCFPILDPAHARRVFDETLGNYLRDNQQAWQLHPDGHYTRVTPEAGQPPFAAQLALLGGLPG